MFSFLIKEKEKEKMAFGKKQAMKTMTQEDAKSRII
jgi:hypothetical protein